MRRYLPLLPLLLLSLAAWSTVRATEEWSSYEFATNADTTFYEVAVIHGKKLLKVQVK